MAAPDLTRHVNGSGVVSGDQLNTFVQSCDTVAQLRNFIGTAGIMVYCRGIAAAADGGQGEFYWNSASVGATDDGVDVIVPSGADAGAWERLPAICRVPRIFTAAGACTVLFSDDVIVINKTSGAATTVNLPASPKEGETHVIKDGKGDAASNPITITPAGGFLVDGAATSTINTAYGKQTVMFDTAQWRVIA